MSADLSIENGKAAGHMTKPVKSNLTATHNGKDGVDGADGNIFATGAKKDMDDTHHRMSDGEPTAADG